MSGITIPGAALDFCFEQAPGEAGILANKIRREDTRELGIILIANAVGTEEIISALEKAGMASTVATLRAALAQGDKKPGVEMGVRMGPPPAPGGRVH